MIVGKPKMFGERLTGLPVVDLKSNELAKLYAYLVTVHGENSNLTFGPIDELKKRDEIGSYSDAYDDGYNAAKAEIEDADE